MMASLARGSMSLGKLPVIAAFGVTMSTQLDHCGINHTVVSHNGKKWIECSKREVVALLAQEFEEGNHHR